jgi:hypothetical protein
LIKNELGYTILEMTLKDLISQIYLTIKSPVLEISMKQQTLPITIKYAEIFGKTGTNFEEEQLPEFGKEGSFFL